MPSCRRWAAVQKIIGDRRADGAPSDVFVRLSFAQHVGKKSATNSDAGLHPPSYDHTRSLTGNAKAATPDPEAPGSIIEFEGALIGHAKRVDHLPGDDHVFRHIPGRIAIDGGDLRLFAAGEQEEQRNKR